MLILDEPVSALDPDGARSLYALVHKIYQQHQMTVVVVEHDLNYLLPYMTDLVLISGGAKEGTIWLYPDDSGLPAPQAAERACLEVQKETPLGAYAVEYLTYTVDETPRNYDAIQLTVGYRRTAAQVAGIVHITSTSALGDLLREAARNHAAELVVQVGYFDHQAEEVRTQVTQIQAEVEPESKEPWTVNFYPDSGNAGIIEVLLSGAGSAAGAEQNTENAN